MRHYAQQALLLLLHFPCLQLRTHLGLGKVGLDLPAYLRGGRPKRAGVPHDVLDVGAIRHRVAHVLVERPQVQDAPHPVDGADHRVCDCAHHVLR